MIEIENIDATNWNRTSSERFLYADITAPLYWWIEFNEYGFKDGFFYDIPKRDFTIEDFSYDSMISTEDMKRIECDPFYADGYYGSWSPRMILEDALLECLNNCKQAYIETKDEKYMDQLIKMLPLSYNQKRSVVINYSLLSNIFQGQEKNRLPEWENFYSVMAKYLELEFFKFDSSTGTITGVTEAGKQLTEINIPAQINGVSVTAIGKSAFGFCTNLRSVTIPVSVTNIGNEAFWDCSSLASVVIPEGVTSIGSSAFEYCSSLASIAIPEGITSIREYAFYGCSSLASITIPNSVTSIGDSAFWCCSSLTSITIPASVTNIGNEAFWDCSSLASVVIPEGVINIGKGAFSYCISLMSITIPTNITSIEDSTFECCYHLKTIIIPKGVTNIGKWAFQDCENLTSVTLPEGITNIGKAAFYNCVNLTSINIPASVTNIGDSAFYRCNSLASINIPESVISIEKDCFCKCENLHTIHIGSRIIQIQGQNNRRCYLGIETSKEKKRIVSDKDATHDQKVAKTADCTAHWVPMSNELDNEEWACSNCGIVYYTPAGNPWENGLEVCPECKAKMDEEEEK